MKKKKKSEIKDEKVCDKKKTEATFFVFWKGNILNSIFYEHSCHFFKTKKK